MFDVIRKREYFTHLEAGYADRHKQALKGIQDGWIMSMLKDVEGKRIMEVGGGNSRVLPQLRNNELWNADKFEGVGNGPVGGSSMEGVTIVPTFMGEFYNDAPTVDIIFSISVIEHIPFDGYLAAFRDMVRCLRPGGVMYHAIDLPLGDTPLNTSRQRIDELFNVIQETRLQLHSPAAIDSDCVFTCDMASHPDLTMWMWSNISNAVKVAGADIQMTSLKMVASAPA